MQSYLKTKPVGIQLLLFLGMAFGILMVVFILGSLVLTKITGFSLMEMSNSAGWDTSNPMTLVLIRGLLALQFFGLFLIPSLLFAYFSDPAPAQYVGLKKPSRSMYWLLGTAALLVALPVVEFTGMLNRQVNLGEGTNQWMRTMEQEASRTLQLLLGKNTLSNLVLNLIFIAGFAAVGEELFFRGIVQRLLIRGLRNPWMGIVLTAFAFSFFHFQFLGFLPRFLLGILLGAVYWYSGSLWTAILAHFVYDASIVVLIHFFPRYAEDSANLVAPSFLPVAALASAALVGLLVWTMKKNSTASYETVYANDFPQPSDRDFSF